MSNLLKVAMIDLILSLHRQGLSQRRIASELGINRETVARYLSQPRDAAKPAIAPSGSIEAEAEPKPAIRPPARLLLSRGQTPSCHRPLRSRRESAPLRSQERVRALARGDFSQVRSRAERQRIYQDLITEHSFTGELLQRPAFRPPIGADEPNCHSAASNAGLVRRLKSTSARVPGSLVPTASAARPISSASCCPTRARPTARSSTARPQTSFSAVSRMPSASLAEHRGGWSLIISARR